MSDYVEIPQRPSYSLTGTMTIPDAIRVPLPISISIPLWRCLYVISIATIWVIFVLLITLFAPAIMMSAEIPKFPKVLILLFIAGSILSLFNSFSIGVVFFKASRRRGPHLTADRSHFWCFQLTKPIPMNEIKSIDIMHGWKRSPSFVRIECENPVQYSFFRPVRQGNTFYYRPNSYTWDLSIAQAIVALGAERRSPHPATLFVQ